MAQTYTRAELITRAVAAADITDHADTATRNQWADDGKAKLQRVLSESGFGFDVQESDLTTDGTAFVSLPSDFYLLLRADLQDSNGGYTRLKQINHKEAPWIAPNSGTSRPTHLDVRGNGSDTKLKLYPTPATGLTISIVYDAASGVFSGDSDTLDGINGFDEYVVQHIAMMACIREESFGQANFHKGLRDEIANEIKSQAAMRNVQDPGRISDTDDDCISEGSRRLYDDVWLPS